MPLKDYSRVLNISNQCCVHLGEYQKNRFLIKKKRFLLFLGALTFEKLIKGAL